MKLQEKKSNLYSFTIMMTVLGLLAMPIGCAHLEQVGSSHDSSTEDKFQGEEVDWTLAKAEIEEDEADWTLAESEDASEDEVDWTLAEAQTEEDETDWTLA